MMPAFKEFFEFLQQARLQHFCGHFQKLSPTKLPSHYYLCLINSFVVVFVYLLWSQEEACRILISWPGMESEIPAVEAQSLNQQTCREVPQINSYSILQPHFSHIFLGSPSMIISLLYYPINIVILIFNFHSMIPCLISISLITG